MNSKLIILANGEPLSLKKDASISVELNNPLFNDVDMFSYPIELPIEGNRHFLKNIDDVSSDIRAVTFEHTPMQIVADGVSLASGTSVIQEDEQLSGSLSLNIDASSQSFDDLIGDLKCNEVPIPAKYHDQLLIGEKIDEVNVRVKYSTSVVIKYQGKKGNKKYGSVGDGYTTQSTFSPQALGFSYPAQCNESGELHEAKLKKIYTYPNGNEVKVPDVAVSYINVCDPYPVKPFCNARVCYAHHDIEADGTTSDSIVQYSTKRKGEDDANVNEQEMYEDRGPIWVLDADRPQSGICFYLLFFLDCLFEYLGVQFDNRALTAVGDLNRLCFFTTKCAYDIEPLHYGSLYEENDKAVLDGIKTEKDVKEGFFHKTANSEKETEELFDDVNAWLDSRGCGGQLKLENPKDKSVQEVKYREVTYKVVEKESDGFSGDKSKETEVVQVKSDWKYAVVGEDKVASITCKSSITSASMSASIFRMYANGLNFPAESVADVIESLEQQFGIKFHFDYEQKKVTAYLIRDVFRKQKDEPRAFHAQLLSMAPMTEKITGVRVGYSAESDSKEQRDNVKNKVKDYNTDYDYIEYPKERTVTSKIYKDIIHEVQNGQMNVYVDLQTGNKYRVKIDKDFTNADNMEPRLFEVAAFKGVEFGDCSSLNEDFIQEFKSSFVPVGMVDANYRKALSAISGSTCASDNKKQPSEVGKQYEGYEFGEVNGSYAKTQMAALVDEDMEHEFVKQYIKNSMSSMVADFYLTEVLSLRESYDPSSTDDGNSPLQSYDWGLAVAVMRGGGIDSTHEPYDFNYDGFGNSKWRTKAGDYALTTDSIDCYGNGFYHNGDGERFSLKPRAWAQPDWADAPLVIGNPEVKNRGYVDTFLIDYIYFLLNRKKYYIECLASVAQVTDIQNHWKEWWTLDGKKFLINKVSADITAADGIGKIGLEVYSF